MIIGIGQLFLILIVILLLFGNLSHIFKDLAEGIKNFQKAFKENNNNKSKSLKK